MYTGRAVYFSLAQIYCRAAIHHYHSKIGVVMVDFVIIARNLFAFFWEVFASVILVLCAEAFE